MHNAEVELSGFYTLSEFSLYCTTPGNNLDTYRMPIQIHAQIAYSFHVAISLVIPALDIQGTEAKPNPCDIGE